jgi:hypothetical protein
MSHLLARVNGDPIGSGKGQFGNHVSLMSVIVGPVLHNELVPCLSVVREKPNLEMSFGRSPALAMSFFE